MLVIACLHTAASNVAVFDAALASLPVAALELRHEVRPDLLREPNEAALEEAAGALEALAPGADAVLLTCSTIGAAVERARAPCPVLRADAALAEAATRGGGQPSASSMPRRPRASLPRALFGAAAARHGADGDAHLAARAPGRCSGPGRWSATSPSSPWKQGGRQAASRSPRQAWRALPR
jgi:hypothetical protein